MYCPYTGVADETQEEYSGYTALMTIAMNAVNSTKYAAMITKSIALLRWMALSDGRVYDLSSETASCWFRRFRRVKRATGS